MSVSVGNWVNVVGTQTILMTMSRSPWTLSPLSHKKYTQTCSFTVSRFPGRFPFIWPPSKKIQFKWPRPATNVCIRLYHMYKSIQFFNIFIVFLVTLGKIIKFCKLKKWGWLFLLLKCQNGSNCHMQVICKGACRVILYSGLKIFKLEVWPLWLTGGSSWLSARFHLC